VTGGVLAMGGKRRDFRIAERSVRRTRSLERGRRKALHSKVQSGEEGEEGPLLQAWGIRRMKNR